MGVKGLTLLTCLAYLTDALLTLNILVYRALRPISTHSCTISDHNSSLIHSLGLLHLHFCELLNTFVLSIIFLAFSFSIEALPSLLISTHYSRSPLSLALHLLRWITYVVVVMKPFKQLLLHVNITTEPTILPALLSNKCTTRLSNSQMHVEVASV